MRDFFRRIYLNSLFYINNFRSYLLYFLIILLAVFTTIFAIRLFDRTPIVKHEEEIIAWHNKLCSLNLYNYCYVNLSNVNNISYLKIFEQLAYGANQRNISSDIVRTALSNVRYITSISNKLSNDDILDYLSQEIDKDKISDIIKQYNENKNLINSIADKYAIDPYILAAIWLSDKLDYKKNNDNIFSVLISQLNQSPFSYEIEGKIYAAMDIVSRFKILPHKLIAGSSGRLGNTQFSPQEYIEYGVDINNDGISDIWHDDYEILSSMANYLNDNGWSNEINSNSYSVLTPINFNWDMHFFNFGICQGSNILVSDGYTLDEWGKKGMMQDNKSLLPNDVNNIFYFLGNKHDRIGNYWHGFLVNKNYFIIMRYACSAKYALKISLISKIMSTLINESGIEYSEPNLE